MGQTLTHGVYLPDEGERNCYSGLASNWSILDNSVGTIAEHASQIAGKAPAVHTHTKSDVTDLLNSNFIPSANNSYDLGSSSYQWNNVYSKGYYYNGVAWGLDKKNVWTADNTFSAGVLTNIIESNPGNTGIVLRATDQSWENGARIFLYSNTHTGQTYGSIYIDVDHGDENHTKTALILVPNALSPAGGGTDGVSLGTSSNKWKTFNGVNPGALSLPDYDDTTYIDISGSIIPPSGETTINKNLGNNTYTPPVDGWLSIRCDGATFLQIYRNSYNCPGITSCDPSGGKLVVTLPVRKNVTYTIRISKTGAGLEYYQLYPCLGNV